MFKGSVKEMLNIYLRSAQQVS